MFKWAFIMLLAGCAPVQSPMKPCDVLKRRCDEGKLHKRGFLCGYVTHLRASNSQEECATQLYLRKEADKK